MDFSYENLTSKQFTTLEMLRWSKEIAIGMQYLSQLNVSFTTVYPYFMTIGPTEHATNKS